MDREFSITPLQVTWRSAVDGDERWAEFRGRILDEWNGIPHGELDRARGDWGAIVGVIHRATGESDEVIARRLEAWSVSGEVDPPEETEPDATP